VLVCGSLLCTRSAHHPWFAAGHWLRADALTAIMVLVIGSVATLSTWASVGYLETELTRGETTPRGARLYGVLVNIFIACMALRRRQQPRRGLGCHRGHDRRDRLPGRPSPHPPVIGSNLEVR